MSVIVCIFVLIKILIFLIIIFLCLVYSLPILFLSRFHSRSNILTLNLTIAFMCCCIYWLIYCISYDYYNKALTSIEPYRFQIYVQIMCTCQLIFAFIVIPINRLFSIIYYTKLFFETKKWLILCIISQWIAAFIVPIPLIIDDNQDGNPQQWTSYYKVIIIIASPILIYIFVNIFIFNYIRSSLRNIQCKSQITQTNTNKISQGRISRHDIHLLRYTIYTFCVFIGGWCPIFILIAVDFEGKVPLIVYIILAVLAEASLFSIIISLFRYNQKLRHYLKGKIFRQR